jgi:hypothetical protein
VSEVSAADEPEIKDFYAVGRAKATEAEVHLFALFIIIGLGHNDRDIRTWASAVADGYGAEFDMLKNSWRPPTKKGEVPAWSKLALVMTEVVKAGKPRLPLCVEATVKILGIDTPSMSALNRWLDGVRRVPERVPLEAPGNPKAKHGNLRYIYEMVPVARLIRLKLNTLRKEYEAAIGDRRAARRHREDAEGAGHRARYRHEARPGRGEQEGEAVAGEGREDRARDPRRGEGQICGEEGQAGGQDRGARQETSG